MTLREVGTPTVRAPKQDRDPQVGAPRDLSVTAYFPVVGREGHVP